MPAAATAALAGGAAAAQVLQQRIAATHQQQMAAEAAALRVPVHRGQAVCKAVGCKFRLTLTWQHPGADEVTVQWTEHCNHDPSSREDQALLAPAAAAVAMAVQALHEGKKPIAVCSIIEKCALQALLAKYGPLPAARTQIDQLKMRALSMSESRQRQLAPTDVQALAQVMQKHAGSVLYFTPQRRDAAGKVTQHLELAISTPFQQVGCPHPGSCHAGACASSRLVASLPPLLCCWCAWRCYAAEHACCKQHQQQFACTECECVVAWLVLY
jgi:hypothetical protein